MFCSHARAWPKPCAYTPSHYRPHVLDLDLEHDLDFGYGVIEAWGVKRGVLRRACAGGRGAGRSGLRIARGSVLTM